ncbi:hypothetical protein [Streptomyces sp. NPDC048419]|uniref:hypothetical protein n=1 Tax=Streptomyces sp. NPDC048419 TaxID=3365547 RepID=UPI00371E967D
MIYHAGCTVPGPLAATGALLELNFEEEAILIPPVWPLESVNNVLINGLPIIPYSEFLVLIEAGLEVGYELIEFPNSTPGVGKIEILAPEIFMCPTIEGPGGPVTTAGESPAILIPIVPPIAMEGPIPIPIEIPLEGLVTLTPDCWEVLTPE